MSKSLVLTIFRLITPVDLSHLTEALKGHKRQMAAGAESLVWDEDEVPAPPAKILSFPDKQPSSHQRQAMQGSSNEPTSLSQMGVLSSHEQKARQKEAQEAAELERPSESNFLLEEREKFKDSEDKMFKQNGFASYQKSSDLSLYRVTITDDKGKEKTRLTSSQGVLVNKKQA